MVEVPALDAAELLAALSRHDVDCVLIGGMAIQAYGHVRTTVDLDVIAAWTPRQPDPTRQPNLHRQQPRGADLRITTG
jgi:hypothetical protein